MKQDKIKIFLVDDHFFFRKSIVNLLKQYKRFEIVGEANNGEEYLTLINNVTVDVVLMDIKMKIMDGILATKTSVHIHPEIKIIAITYERDNENLSKIIQAGAKGILNKDVSIKEIAEAIITVYNGNSYSAKK